MAAPGRASIRSALDWAVLAQDGGTQARIDPLGARLGGASSRWRHPGGPQPRCWGRCCAGRGRARGRVGPRRSAGDSVRRGRGPGAGTGLSGAGSGTGPSGLGLGRGWGAGGPRGAGRGCSGPGAARRCQAGRPAAVRGAALRQRRYCSPLAGSPLVQAARAYARPARRRSQELPSHLDDIPPTALRKEYANLPVIDKADDVVKRILSLEMAGQREKVKIKMEQLAEKVRRAPNDNGSYEVQVAHLTAKIRSYQEHLQKHPKDARNRRVMLMAIDQQQKMLKYLRHTRYDLFENTCKQLGIEYTFPQPYHRKVTRLWLVKKAFCLKVFEEVQKLKASERLKQRQESQEKARAEREQAQQRDGTPV